MRKDMKQKKWKVRKRKEMKQKNKKEIQLLGQSQLRK